MKLYLWWVWLSWLEHWVVAPEVKGSSPFTHPKGSTSLETELIIQCPSCNSRFSIDSAKISSPSSKGRCSVCGHVFPLLEHAVEDMEVAELRDKFEREKAERAKKAIGFREGVYGSPPIERKISEESPLEAGPEEETKQPDYEPFPELEEETAEEAILSQEVPEKTFSETAHWEEELEPSQASSELFEEEDVEEWAEKVFPAPEEGEEPAGWEEDLAKEIDEAMKPGEPARRRAESDFESEIGIQTTPSIESSEVGYEKRETEGVRDEETLSGTSASVQANTEEPFQRVTAGGEKSSAPPWEGGDSEISFEDVFPSEKESRRSLSFRLFLLLLLIIALVGGGWYLYETGTLTSPGSVTGRIMERINALRGRKSMVLFDLKNEQEPALDGKFFAVRGMVQNKGGTTVSYVPLRIKIFDERGRVILTGRTVAGKVLTAEEISKMTVGNVLKAYRSQKDKNRRVSGRLAPGEKLPFLFLFDLNKFPRKIAKTFQVEILKGS